VKSAPPAQQPLQSKEDAMDAMKRRYEAQMDVASAEQAKVYAAAGAELMAKKSFVQAANSYRLALAMNPNDEAIKTAAEEAFAQANEILVETYQKSARDEERNENWPEAARQWTRVAQIKTTDAIAADHAANAIQKAGGDLRQAADLAKRAISLAPKQVGYRITLANVYIAAGMTQSARRELEVALELSPTNKHIPTMLKSLKK
jgi:tetratricopeptide (TPR) repeat protein